MTPANLARLMAARAAKRPVALLTHLADGAQLLWPDDIAPEPVATAARDAVAADAATNAEGWFIQPHNPPLRMLVVGAVHVSQHLAPMAVPLGFAVTVIDPRRAFATPERFADIVLNGDWPDEAMAALAPDSRTAVVTLTHDPKLDDPALDAALRSAAFYIGALGSRRTHAKRVERLRELGHDDTAIGRIRAPVGLPIRAVTAPEIALSVLAEIVASRRGATLVAAGSGAITRAAGSGATAHAAGNGAMPVDAGSADGARAASTDFAGGVASTRSAGSDADPHNAADGYRPQARP